MSAPTKPLSTPPAEGQSITHNGQTYTTIREGGAFILIPPHTSTFTDPKAAKEKKEKKEKKKNSAAQSGSDKNGTDRLENGMGSDVAQKVFYNPIQQFNRDLSVLCIKAFAGHFVAEKKRKRGGVSKRERKKRKREEWKAERVGGEGVEKVRKGEDGERIVEEPAEGGAAALQELSEGVKQNGNKEEEKKVNGAEVEEAPKPSFRILDALSATGLRALRYAAEIPQATAIVANDMDRKAVSSIRTNVEHNNFSGLITPNISNAIGHMYAIAYPSVEEHGTQRLSGKYDVIDLDPYGTAAPFLDSALQALNDGGLLCVTCTDSGVFASCGYSEKTFSLYGGIPVKGPHAHEGGLRIILQSIASTAAKYGIAIEPLLSLSIDFYVRMFVRIRKSPLDVKFLSGKSMIVYECDSGCGAFQTQFLGRNVKQAGKADNVWWKHTIAQAPSADRFCEHCGSKTHISGPMWGGPIHNAAFVQRVLDDAEKADTSTCKTIPRIQGMLDTALDELIVIDHAAEIWPKVEGDDGNEAIIRTPAEVQDHHPFFFMPSALAKVIHCQSPPDAPLRGALRHAGYKATRSHCKPGSIKTDAPWSAIWQIMREWVRQKSPIKEGAIKENTPGWKIMYSHPSPPEESPQHESGKDPGPPEITVEGAGAATEKPKDPRRFKVVFDEVLGKDRHARKLVRYQQNPRENWGPMARAKGSA